MCSDEGRDDCQLLKPKESHTSFVTTVIAVTILLMPSILFSRVTVSVLVSVLRVVFYVTQYITMLGDRILRLRQVLFQN